MPVLGTTRRRLLLAVALAVALVALVAPPATCQLDAARRKSRENNTKCPQVKAIRNFHLEGLLGQWYVVQYYASSEEALSYRCMRAVLWVSPLRPEVSMNFTYVFADDPDADLLAGNITWRVPDPARPAHWLHEEDSYEGVYNTYVLDSDYRSWALLLHCAEKSGSPRYLSSFVMSRRPEAEPNVVSYLRDKLPRYDVDLEYVFAMRQDGCPPGPGGGGGGGGGPGGGPGGGVDPRLLARNLGNPAAARRRHPMQNVH
ncbi:uncharacterized protein LOC134542954 [Bacillus rossius redtenbacheri]|uniref:uncharacterized protein LOC134542954 n=1 Tax=Bacillus rossius redtenbacheri TaxID=93214 RepID=UPI002FDE76CC